ncbi:DUF6221 family protein [Streptomyces albogriseolus]|uniref:DUF6221 family protein n=1 Tax=Streptomyces albogriseolus TaxID=1887 RepID=UPI0036F7FE94
MAGVQLDEDERTAREAGGAAWEELPVSGWVHTSPLPDTEWQPPGYDHHVASAPLSSDRAHIVRHDPARVLREIDAKQRIIQVHNARDSWGMCVACPRDEKGAMQVEIEDCPILRALALPYADRPGYKESWRP